MVQKIFEISNLFNYKYLMQAEDQGPILLNS